MELFLFIVALQGHTLVTLDIKLKELWSHLPEHLCLLLLHQHLVVQESQIPPVGKKTIKNK